MDLLILGAGGAIGGHLARVAKTSGLYGNVTGVDIKPLIEWWQPDACDETYPKCDAGAQSMLEELMGPDVHVVNFAADMGGMGYITGRESQCMDSVDTTLSSVRAAKATGVERYLFSSSACVYPYVPGRLPEDLVYTGPPEPGYGEEKLFSERYVYFNGYSAVRFHNVYGPQGSWRDGREKAPAAACRKLAVAKRDGLKSVEVWGDGKAERTFLYVTDACEAVLKMLWLEDHTGSQFKGPVNVGSEELVSVNALHRIAMDVAGYHVDLVHVDGPVGAPSRCSHNDLAEQELGWSPSVSLRDGMKELYSWVEAQVMGS